jgi:hypothetical protein
VIGHEEVMRIRLGQGLQNGAVISSHDQAEELKRPVRRRDSRRGKLKER